MQIKRWIWVGFIAILFVVSLGIGFVISNYIAGKSGSSLSISNTLTERAFAAPFQLIDHNGEPITEKAFTGNHISAVFFGFTYCPDICPTTLNDLSLLREELAANANKLHIFFITLDPARDTVAVLKDYIPYFGPGITGITGSEKPLYDLARKWGIYWEKADITDSGYNINHTATTFLLDQKGQFKGTIDSHESSDVALLKIQRLVKKITP